MLDRLYHRLEDLFSEMVSIRRDLHMHPELSFQEVETPKKIAEYHRRLGLEVRANVGGRGVVAVLNGGKPGKTVALRADFDALAIQDQKQVAYRSKVPGVMHACGHDAHTAQLLVTAKALAEIREQIEGRIVFIHQFAEEITPGGAKPMIEDGCLDGVDVVFGTHLWTDDPVGRIGVSPGYVMASVDDFEIVIKGSGGHGGSPHQTVDPVVAASQLVCHLQTIVSRRIDPLQSAVVTVGSIQSGDTFNVIPGKAKLMGTVRALGEENREKIMHWIREITEQTCRMFGAVPEITYNTGTRRCGIMRRKRNSYEQRPEKVVGPKDVFEKKPVMAGEDFAYYLQRVPGVYFFTGARNEKTGASYPHHHPMFDLDERAMLIAAKTLATAALDYLHASSQTRLIV